MPRKPRDPASDVLTYFDTAPLVAAQTILGICQAIVARRMPKPGARRRSKINNDQAVTDHNGISVTDQRHG